MTTALMRRILSLGLLLTFFGGGLGMPLADAALDHRAANHEGGRIHVESSGNPLCHAERCVLGLAAANTGVATRTGTPALGSVLHDAPLILYFQPAAPRPAGRPSHHSRAPPPLS